MQTSLVIAFFLVLGVTLAQRPVVAASGAHTPILDQTFEKGPDGSYHFGYTSGDGSTREETSVVKNTGTDAQTNVVQGSYSYISPEGTPVTVNYVADEDGYRANGNVVNPAAGGEAVLTRQRQLAATLGYHSALHGAYNSLAYRNGVYSGNPLAYRNGVYPAHIPSAVHYPGAYSGYVAPNVVDPRVLAHAGVLTPEAAARINPALLKNNIPAALAAKTYQGAYTNTLYNRFYANGINPYYNHRVY